MICSYSLAKDIIPNVALMIHIKAVVLQEAPGFGEVKTFPLKQQASENDDLTVQRNSLDTKSKMIDTKSKIIDTKSKIIHKKENNRRQKQNNKHNKQNNRHNKTK